MQENRELVCTTPLTHSLRMGRPRCRRYRRALDRSSGPTASQGQARVMRPSLCGRPARRSHRRWTRSTTRQARAVARAAHRLEVAAALRDSTHTDVAAAGSSAGMCRRQSICPSQRSFPRTLPQGAEGLPLGFSGRAYERGKVLNLGDVVRGVGGEGPSVALGPGERAAGRVTLRRQHLRCGSDGLF